MLVYLFLHYDLQILLPVFQNVYDRVLLRNVETAKIPLKIPRKAYADRQDINAARVVANNGPSADPVDPKIP